MALQRCYTDHQLCPIGLPAGPVLQVDAFTQKPPALTESWVIWTRATQGADEGGTTWPRYGPGLPSGKNLMAAIGSMKPNAVRGHEVFSRGKPRTVAGPR